ncbi:PQQ-binding-like beta-propeller repeat protein [Streptomyces sp. NPDC046203]|uniref:outer membrane protein assembly factor BamB family protein n=1 Tax=Streptomyces sp. NPDC046203 TaxID=3154602 RepID=UPI003411E5E8
MLRGLVLSSVLAMGVAIPVGQPASAENNEDTGNSSASSWPTGGHDVYNTRSNPDETKISPKNADKLAVKWAYTTNGDVSATPAVAGGAVYFPDWGGYLHKVDAKTGKKIWSHRVSEYNGITGSVSRSNPTVVGGTVYIGDTSGAHLLAINATTGTLRWSTQVDSHPYAILTQSPVVYDGVVYQGVSSRESELGLNADFKCCTFRGSANAIDAETGKVLWRHYTVPENGGQTGGYSGGAIWGTPAIDPKTKTVYFTTGQNYNVPQSVNDCQNAGNKPYECHASDNHIDSVLALDMRNGAFKWTSGARLFDAFNTGCIPGFPPNNCPANPGPDYDFGEGAHLFTINVKGKKRSVIGAGQKSGEYWLLDATTGEVVWSAALAPGGNLGGIQWGTATDGKRIYVAEANSKKLPYQLPDGTTTNGSSFAALDPVTGKTLWQIADPTNGLAWGALTVANGVLYASSTSGHMYAIDAANGKILWDHLAPYSPNAGAAVVDGTVYWGNGYVRMKDAAGATGSLTTGTFYAFSVNGK